MEFPELKAQAIRLARLYRAAVLLVEDQSSGIALIHELRKYPEAGVPVPIARKTEGDKISRVEGVSAMVEAGQLLRPMKRHGCESSRTCWDFRARGTTTD